MPLVVFSSASGGVGCSTACGQSGHLLQGLGQSAMLADFCANNGLALAVGMPALPLQGWSDDARPNSWKQQVQIASDGLRLLPYGSPLQAIGIEQLSELKAYAVATETTVLVDAGLQFLKNADYLVQIADLLICCVVPSVLCMAQMQHCFAENQLHGQSNLKVLVSRFDVRRQSQREALEQIRASFGPHILHDVIHEDEHLSMSAAQGIPLHELFPHAQSAHDFQGLVRMMQDFLGQRGGPA